MEKYYKQMGVRRRILMVVLIGGALLFSGCTAAISPSTALGGSSLNAEKKVTTEVTFLDVGQADAIFVRSGTFEVLIDAGNREDGDEVVAFLKKMKVEKLDYFIGTHPHEDHIGGAAEVLNEVGADHIMMPKASSNTKTFENLLKTIKTSGMKIQVPKPGDRIYKNKEQEVVVMAPASTKYKETNEYSIVIKVVDGKRSILLMGDAEAVSEKELMAGKEKLKADVLKVGHHGGRTSTSSEFLKSVSPSYAIISVGNDNSYKHPHSEVLKRLKNIKVLRTDLNGNITVKTDGDQLFIKTAQ